MNYNSEGKCHLILEPVGPAREDVALPPRTRRSPSARSLCPSCAPASLEGSAAVMISLHVHILASLLAFDFDTFEAPVRCGLDFAGDDTKRGIFDGF